MRRGTPLVVLGQLERSPIPVYLPSWVPHWHTHVSVTALTFSTGYAVALSTCRPPASRCIRLAFSAETVASSSTWITVPPSTRIVAIRRGVRGYLVITMGAPAYVRLMWYEHDEVFSLACTTAHAPCTDAHDVRVAASLIRAH